MEPTGLTPALRAFEYMRSLFNDPAKFADLARIFIDPCNPSHPIEACIDDICLQDGGQLPVKLTRSTRNFLNNQVKGLMNAPAFLTMFKSPGVIMRAFLEGQKDVLCQPDNVAEAEASVKKTIAETAPAPQPDGDTTPAEFAINVTAQDAARAGALTAGAALVYRVLLFGATVYPPARPAAQGIMMYFFGITPTGFDYKSPTDRMIDEGA